MNEAERTQVVERVAALVEAHYVYPEVAAKVSGALASGLVAGRYPAEEVALAAAVTRDLQSVNADKHLRLLYRAEGVPYQAEALPRQPGDDAREFAAMAQWADQTCGGVACVQRLAGNVGYLELQPVLFPTVICGEAVTAAMSLLASTDALIIDLRACLGGEPSMPAFLISYLWDHEPAQLTGLQEREDDRFRQAWTLPYVPGRRFGKTKPVYVLTSATTFSGGEQLSYDLQLLGRATVVGERTRGGAHAREGFAVHPHLEATISVAAAVNPKDGGSWEGTGVAPDIETTAAGARPAAYQLALEQVIAAAGPASAEAGQAMAALRPGPA